MDVVSFNINLEWFLKLGVIKLLWRWNKNLIMEILLDLKFVGYDCY